MQAEINKFLQISMHFFICADVQMRKCADAPPNLHIYAFAHLHIFN